MNDDISLNHSTSSALSRAVQAQSARRPSLQVDFNQRSGSPHPHPPLSITTGAAIPPSHSLRSPLPLPPLSAGAESSTSVSSLPTPTATGDVSPRNTSASGNRSTAPAKEKRKRSRVTPEQLAQLERIFVMDKSPTAQRRKEISEMLGMQERQTQIWFQNRRAKAKLQDVKRNSMSQPVSGNTPPRSTPELGSNNDAEMQALIHEDDSVFIIPCLELSVGTWRRIATPPPMSNFAIGIQNKPSPDLVAYMSPARRCLSWYIHSTGFGFKMEIPFESITNSEYTDSPANGQGQVMATFFLDRPPNFYLETATTSPASARGRISIGGYTSGSNSGMAWKRCADWTEGMQASSVLRHELIGSAPQIMHVLRVLRGDQTHQSTSPLQLLTTPYATSTDPTPGAAMRLPPTLPQPPLSSVHSPHSAVPSPLSASAGYGFHDGGSDIQRQRSYNDVPPAFSDPFPSQHVQDVPYSPSTQSYNSVPQLSIPLARASYSTSEFGYSQPSSATSSVFSSGSQQGSEAAHHSLNEYVGIPIPHSRGSLPAIHTTSLSVTPPHERRYSSGNTSFGNSASPPLITTPFTPSDTSAPESNMNHAPSPVYSTGHTNGNGHETLGMGYSMHSH